MKFNLHNFRNPQFIGYFKLAKVQLESILQLPSNFDFVKYLKRLVRKNDYGKAFWVYAKKTCVGRRSQHRSGFSNK